MDGLRNAAGFISEDDKYYECNPIEAARDYAKYILDATYQHIKHGDDEHQKWLKDKLEELKKEL